MDFKISRREVPPKSGREAFGLHFYENLMLAAVIRQWDVICVEKPAIQTQASFAFCDFDADVIVCRTKAIADFNLAPVFG